MKMLVLQKKIEYALPLWFGMLFFFLLVSTSLKSVALVTVLLSIFLLPNFKEKAFQIVKTRWCQTAFFLFLVVVFACFWGPAPLAKKITILKQYTKLLCLPILAIGLSDVRNRQAALIGFLGSMLFTALLSIGGYYGLLQDLHIQYDFVFFNHIITGFSMSFAAFLALFYVFKTQGKMKALCLFLFVLFTFHVLFINLGRTGYVMYALMLGLFLLMYLPWKHSLIALLVLGSFLVGAYTLSPSIKTGVNQVVLGYQHFDRNKNTSVGYRMQFHQYAVALFKRHPWLGNGTASFPTLYAQEIPVPEFGNTLNEPHGFYWLVASEYGLLGLMALFCFFVSLLLEANSLVSMRIPAVVFLLSFMVTNLTDSLFVYSAPGFLFILFAAYYLGEKQRAVDKKPVMAGTNSLFYPAEMPA